MNHSITIMLFILCTQIAVAIAQDNLSYTLQQADSLMSVGNYSQAKKLLDAERAKSKDNFYVSWSYVKLMGESGDTDMMMNEFVRTLDLYNPREHKEIKWNDMFVNYSEYLIRHHHYVDALDQLDWLIYDHKVSYTLLEYIYQLYYKVCREQHEVRIDAKNYKTLDKLERVLSNRKQAVLHPLSPNKGKEWSPMSFVNLGTEAMKDIQPMKAFSTRMKAGLPISNLLNLSLQFYTDTYYSNAIQDVTLWKWYASNKFTLWKPNLDIVVGLGWIDRNKMTGEAAYEIDVTKRIKNILSFNAGYNRQRYVGTLASVFDYLVMQNNLYLNIEHQFKNRYTIAFQTQQSRFHDRNKVFSVGAWGLVNVPTFKWMSLNVGYGFSYSNADEIRYIPEEKYDDLLKVYQSGDQVSAVYSPYFTPNEQKIHLGIASLGLNLGKKLHLEATLKYAIKATCQAPLVYMYVNEEGYPYTLIFYYKADYKPYDANVKLSYKPLAAWSIDAFYNQNETFYFKENRIGINTTITF